MKRTLNKTKTTLKLIFSVILVFSILVSLIPFSSVSAEEQMEVGDFKTFSFYMSNSARKGLNNYHWYCTNTCLSINSSGPTFCSVTALKAGHTQIRCDYTYWVTDALNSVSYLITGQEVFFINVKNPPCVNHTFGAWTDSIKPTCTSSGTMGRTCSVCGYYESTAGKAALGHNYKNTEYSPTCTENGYIVTTCSRCSYKSTKNTKNALGHQFGSWITEKEAGSYEKGLKKRVCARCNFAETQEIPETYQLKVEQIGAKTLRVGGISPDCDLIRYAIGSYKTIAEIKKASSATFAYPNGAKYVDITVSQYGNYTFGLRFPESNTEKFCSFNIFGPFTDIPEDSWYTDSVLWCNSNNLFSGTSEITFNPSGNFTRAMLVQILAKLDGVKLSKIKYSGKFGDVKSDAWYANAVQWAVNSGITGGVGSGKFAPDSPVTREQLATFFFAYAKYKKYDLTASASLGSYTDSKTISPWAEGAVKWAVKIGILSGTSKTLLSPKSSTSRAQAAVIFKSFSEKYLKNQK